MTRTPEPAFSGKTCAGGQPGESRGPASLAAAALEMIIEDSVVGLGTGRAATAFVQALGQQVRRGFRIRGVPTSLATARTATSLGIPLVGLDEIEAIDVTVDGADEVDPNMNLIKGLGGALVREKIVASASRRLIILVGAEKLVPVLGSRGVLPVEVVPFGLALCRMRLAELGFASTARQAGGALAVTDNGNNILDCNVPALTHPPALERTLRDIPGVVGTGLFLDMADTVLILDGNRTLIRRRRPSLSQVSNLSGGNAS
jgi:ribose 5-phosphate isomerase A